MVVSSGGMVQEYGMITRGSSPLSSSPLVVSSGGDGSGVWYDYQGPPPKVPLQWLSLVVLVQEYYCSMHCLKCYFFPLAVSKCFVI